MINNKHNIDIIETQPLNTNSYSSIADSNYVELESPAITYIYGSPLYFDNKAWWKKKLLGNIFMIIFKNSSPHSEKLNKFICDGF